MHELEIYNKVINNLIYGNEWQKTINKEFQNLNSYEIGYYIILLSNCKIVNYK